MAKNRGILGATMTGVLGQVNKKKLDSTEEISLHGRTCLVTGAGSGLGKATAIALAARGAHVVMGVRRMDEECRKEIASHAKSDEMVVMEFADLASLESVNEFAVSINQKGIVFDVVVLNAAVVTKSASTTADNLDEMTQVNFISNVALVEALLKNGSFREPADNMPPRIVIISSEAHRWTESIDIDSIGTPKNFGLKGSLPNYSDTKFMMAAYFSNLANRFKTSGEAAVTAICPGAINSNLARQAPGWIQPLLKVVFKLFFATPQKAAEPVINLCVRADIKEKNGSYFHLWKEKPVDSRAGDPGFYEPLFKKTTEIIEEKAKLR
jgi:NAD(P)-dependent dehydrogenase (short-subunit alcohol dehydrogenase family)